MLAAGFLALAFAAGDQMKPGNAYSVAIAMYGAGKVDEACAVLASLSPSDLQKEAQAEVEDAIRVHATDDIVPRGAERRLEAAAILHTECALGADTGAKQAAFDVDMANLLLSFDRARLKKADPGNVRRQSLLTRWAAVASTALLDQGLDQNAIEIIDAALNAFPDDRELLLSRGLVLEFQAVWVGFSWPDPRAALPSMAIRNGSGFDMLPNSRVWGPVRDAYRRVLQVDPNVYEAHLHVGYALYWLRSYSEARTEYELARDHATNPFIVYMADLLLARLDEDQGDLDAAAGEYERAIARVAGAQTAYIGLGVLEMRRGNALRARELTARMMAIPAGRRVADPWQMYRGARLSVDDLLWLRTAVAR